MSQLQKYTWLIETIRRAGKISLKDLSDKWERNKKLSDYRPLHRATFNHWRDAIREQWGIIIGCQTTGGYQYYIANPESIDEDKLRKWMLDSCAVSNIIDENWALKDRIMVDEIPSGHENLTTVLQAMKENHRLQIKHRPFGREFSSTFVVEPYCVRLFENRWYMVARNNRSEIRIYGLDRIEEIKETEENFRIPKDFTAAEFFSGVYGVTISNNEKTQRIVIRAYENHQFYLKSLPLHHTQRLMEQTADYADFELILPPTNDFIMKLLQAGPLVEVLAPSELRETMLERISQMHRLYKP